MNRTRTITKQLVIPLVDVAKIYYYLLGFRSCVRVSFSRASYSLI